MSQHDIVPVHKTSFINTLFTKVGVKELVWPSQTPELNPAAHLQDELECWLCTRPPCGTPLPDFTNSLVAESHSNASKSSVKPSQKF